MKSIALIAINSANRYSGGRIHALWLAYAFAANGYEVDYYTNAIPVFFGNMPEKHRDSIHFHINKMCLWQTKNCQYSQIIMVPHLAGKPSPIRDRYLFYPFARRLKKRNKCKMWYLDFESPNWIQEMDPTLRPMSKYKYSNEILKDCDVVLSTSKIGQEYARTYYSKFNPDLKFCQLYLAINTYAALDIDIKYKENRTLFFARFGQKHKNNEAIFKVVDCLPEGFQLDILGNKNAAEPAFISKLESACKEKNIGITFYKNISDREKFELLSKVKMVFFSSKFEGYGIPPLEAQYMGASVICSDIPVLREVNPMASFVEFDNKAQLKDAIDNLLANPQDPDLLRKKVETCASPEVFFKNLGKIIK